MEEVSKFLAKIGSSHSIPIVENNHTKRLHGGVQKKAGTLLMCTGFTSNRRQASGLKINFSSRRITVWRKTQSATRRT